jgi:hypothetical protein
VSQKVTSRAPLARPRVSGWRDPAQRSVARNRCLRIQDGRGAIHPCAGDPGETRAEKGSYRLFECGVVPLLAPESPGWAVETVLPGSAGPRNVQRTAHCNAGAGPGGARAGAAWLRRRRHHDRPRPYLGQGVQRGVNRMAAAICARFPPSEP